VSAVIEARDAASLERLSALPHADLVHLRAVRDAFAALRTATNDYLGAALAAHLALATLARKEQ
jgi:hypothetical protein